MRKLILSGLVLAFGMQACMDQEDPNKELRELLERQDIEISRHLEENNIDADKDTYGTYISLLQENASGEKIEAGDVAEVGYRLTQLDGTLIGHNEEDSMRVAYDGDGTFIPVYLYFGLSYMREGEAYRFYLPFENAYNNYSLEGVVPYHEIVVMDLEVKQVLKTAAEIKVADIQKIERVISANGEDADTLGSSEVRKVLLEAGEGEQIDDEDEVKVYYTGKLLNGEVFDTNTGASGKLFTVTVGNGQVIPGFETAIESMKEGEKAVFYLPSVEGYGKNQNWYVAPEAVREDFMERDNGRYASAVTIPPHSPLVFEIEVVEVTKK